MTLTARAIYQNNQTIINVKENDVSKNVFFDVTVDGDRTKESEATLVALAIEAFAQQYIPQYATQLTNAKITELNQTIETSKAQQAKTEEMMKLTSGMLNEIIASMSAR
ncbi:DUF1366 domain-containing protein [Parabacteroides distasonis]|uniref:DUF1366 domain-containing protein n=3 Tax=cellular organisms TaxID=131567 RepID=A0A7K0GMY1_PARDI|nr:MULTISPECIES: DUF1366 domain-containing protein [Bacteria]MRY60402.1 DUF1366 domain-containing protein [Parabacteroides distasonis]MTT67242.1 DUF1366 domain-containing protein [Parasutterella excrementihominis]MTU43325.1 DUF1366 domain-containing protein [Parasutterella excrementihominis]